MLRRPLALPLVLLLVAGAAVGQPAESTPPAPDVAEATQPAESTRPAREGGEDGSGLPPPRVLPEPPTSERTWSGGTRIADMLLALGEPAPPHARPADPALVAAGRELFVTGRTTGPDGRRTRRLSPSFECTDCHNIVVEDPDLRASDPEARLDFAVAHDLPFLPGTTMAGVTDRRSWFNDDYVKKYGALVEPANRSLVEAIRLCTIECSQGRPPTDWEIEALLSWFGTLGLRWADLAPGALTLGQAEAAARSDDAAARAFAVGDLRARFLPASPATFGEPPPRHGRGEEGYGLPGDPARGRAVFARSCLHCHGKGGVSDYPLSERRPRLAELRANQGRRDKWSYFVAVRHGTKPFGGHYMPLFPLERLSDRQVEDLRAYIDAGTRRR